MFNKATLKSLLSEYDTVQVDRYVSYLEKIATEKDKDKKIKNEWVGWLKDEQLAEAFKKVDLEGLVFDGIHVTWQSTGVSFDYVAYKKKMYVAYPESEFDAQLVYKGDTFSFRKENGKVIYNHSFANPFEKKDTEIIGAYAIAKNRRGEFIVTLTLADITKHRKVARTDTFWASWFPEMVMKTVAKKVCKQFFADEFQGLEDMDNEQYDPDKVVAEDLSYIDEIKAIDNLNDLVTYYNTHKGKGKEFDAALVERKAELIEERKKRDALAVTPPTDENP